MKKLIEFRFILILIFALFSFFKVSQIFADEACSPYDCAGTNAYFRVDSCTFQSSYCGIETFTPSAEFSCTVGGGAGSCVGPTPGRLGCITTNQYTTCNCSNDPSANGDCTAPGQSCGSYGGYCTDCVNYGTCSVEQSSTLGCCLITGDPPPPPPPPTGPYCGDGICNGTDTCANCETECGVCTPPPTGNPYCGDGTCNDGETNCDCNIDCTGTCPPDEPFCSVSLVPSTINLNTDDSPFNITANVYNVQYGSVSQVEFNKSNSNVNMSPVFDTSSPWQSQITPVAQGTTTLTANVYMGGGTPICYATATVNISVDATASDEAPDCEAFDVIDPVVTSGDLAHYVVEITDDGLNIISDNSFETGTVSFWPTTNNISEWWAVDSLDWGSDGIDGRYYAKIKRANATDPHVATDWIQTGENLTNQEYTYTFLGKSHGISNTVPNLLLQREPFNGNWTGTGAFVWPSPEFIHTAWKKFRYDLTFPNPGNGSNTTRLRAVLRPPQNDWPVYYDKVKVFKTDTAGVDADTVEFFFMPITSDPCVYANWTSLGIGERQGSTDLYEMSWNTTNVPPGNYYVRINVRDVEGNLASGNPGLCGAAGVTYRLSCGSVQEIVDDDPSCADDQPTVPTSFRVNGEESNNSDIDLTDSPNLTFTWVASTIPFPAQIDHYEIWVWDVNESTNGTDPPASCDNTSATSCKKYNTNNGIDTTWTVPAHFIHTDNMRAAVRAVNNSCAPIVNSNWSNRRTHDLVAEVSGTIYESSSTGTGNNCPYDPNNSPINISIANPVMYTDTGDGGTLTTPPGDDYVLSNVPYAPNSNWQDSNFNLTLDLTGNTFTCNCPGNCVQTDTLTNGTSQDFFVTQMDLSGGPWWQAREGNIYGASGYTSPIPNTCADAAPACNANLIRRNTDSDSKSAGIPISGGTVDANGYFTEYDGTNQPRAFNTSHANVVREDYDYFTKNIDLSSLVQLNETIWSIPDSGTVYGDTQLFFRPGHLIMDLGTQQLVTSGTKKVIFVNGNVTITGADDTFLINVENGGYFAIIASGSITIENTVGNPCSYPSGCLNMVTNIDGVYIASNELIIEDDDNNATKDNIFIGRGTFVGWNGVKLNRSFNNTANPFDATINNEDPTNIFRFRPDFTKNTPEILRSPNLVWQEVN